MQLVVFILFYPILWFISILPFRVIYILSDLVYFLVYYVVRYRRKVVKENLALALPHLSAKERLVIEKKSYQHLCDIFLEMGKTMGMSRKEMSKRFHILNEEIFREYEEQNKSIMLMASHYASWEWLLTINNATTLKGMGVYKRISNNYFDKLIRDIRSRFGTELVVTRETIPYIAKKEKEKIACVYGFASDQSPKKDRILHWCDFMGVEAPVHTGSEMIAKKYNIEVVFIKVKRVKRGDYVFNLIPISKTTKQEPQFKITEDFIKLVENQILEAPEFYFWTHKRWKHKKE